MRRLSRERALRRARERARLSVLEHLHTEAPELARYASKATEDPVAAPTVLHVTASGVDAGTSGTTTSNITSTTTSSPIGRRHGSTRATRLRDRRIKVAHWRRMAAALGAIVFAGLGSTTLVSSAAVANVNPDANSVHAFGAAPDLGSEAGIALQAGVVGIAGDPSAPGYWLVGADGGVFAFGSATFFGSTAQDHLNAPIVAIAATPDGGGYWLVGADGGVFAFGDATYEGSVAGLTLAAPITAMVPTHDGHGYWLVGTDGGVFAFGNARFHGSAEDLALASPIVGGAASNGGHGYWLVGADGGIFAFGDARFHGSQPDLQTPTVGIAASANGHGYWIAHADGSVSSFGPVVAGTASTLDLSGEHPDTVGIAASSSGGYWLAQGAIDPASSLGNDAFLACTRAHESEQAGGYGAVSGSGTYRGAYQFDQGTWNSAAQLAGRDDLVGVDPASAAPADQDLLAMALFHARGTQPWGGRCSGMS